MSYTAVMCFSGAHGGMEHDAIKLARLLARSRDVVLVCKENAFIHETGCRQDGGYACEAIDFSSRKFSFSMLFGVRNIIKKYDIKNVIFFGASELKTLHFAFLGFELNVIVRHGTTKSRPKTDWLHRLVYSDVNHHVALSEHLLRNVRKIVPATPGADYRIIYSAFDAPAGELEQKPVSAKLAITHVGRIASGKGQVDAVMACNKLAEAGTDFTLDFLGGVEDTKVERELRDAIDTYGLNEKVSLRGHVTNVSEVLAGTDIFLFPSAGEGMPNAFIEALHYGVPCLAYANTVFPEFIDMGFHVVLAKDGDQGELSEMLLSMAKNIDKEKKAASDNIALAKEYFNTEREQKCWNEILL